METVNDDYASSEPNSVPAELRAKAMCLQGLFLSLEEAAVGECKPSIETLHLILRHLHSLGETFGTANRTAAAACARAMESVLVKVREGTLALSEEMLQLASTTMDQLAYLAHTGEEDSAVFQNFVKS